MGVTAVTATGNDRINNDRNNNDRINKRSERLGETHQNALKHFAIITIRTGRQKYPTLFRHFENEIGQGRIVKRRIHLLPLRSNSAVAIPILLSLPTMFFSIPPLVILVPAVLSFGIQLMATRISFGAPLAVIPNRLVESHLGMLNRMLTLGSIVGVHQRDRNEPGQRRHQ
jgi:hypothetical protein